MSWASKYIIDLQAGHTVEFRPRGYSMVPLVQDNQLVKVAPLKDEPEQGDIVLCVVQGRQYLHLVKAVQGDRVLIGNNKGGLNGWTPRKHVYGVLVR